MRIQGWGSGVLACIVLSCVSCRQATGLSLENADAGAAGHAAQDDARGAQDDAQNGAQRGSQDDAQMHAQNAAASFVACEAQTASLFGPNAGLMCDRCGPHGSCSAPDPSQGECHCASQYVGERCELCADSYVEHEGACVTPCQAAGFPCAGMCTGTVEQPACECGIGYEGPECDRCSAGFGPDTRIYDGFGCVPTCNGACALDEDCIASSRDEQVCECTIGYARDKAGTCVWQRFTADPTFEQGCANWQLIRQVANPTDVVVADIAPSELKLSVDHRCSTARAIAEVYPPAEHSLPRAAVVVTASGIPGALLHVSVQHGITTLIGPPLGEALSGTGDWQRYVVCLPVWDRGMKASIELAVGESGTCAEPLGAAFVVRSLEVVSDVKCEKRP